MIYDTFNYVYVSLLEKGYTRIKVKASNHNKVFKNTSFSRKGIRNSLFNKYEYYYNGKMLIIQKLPSFLGKVFLSLVAPVFIPFILMYGFEEMKYEYSKIYFPKKYGSFVTYSLENKDRDIILGHLDLI